MSRLIVARIIFYWILFFLIYGLRTYVADPERKALDESTDERTYFTILPILFWWLMKIRPKKMSKKFYVYTQHLFFNSMYIISIGVFFKLQSITGDYNYVLPQILRDVVYVLAFVVGISHLARLWEIVSVFMKKENETYYPITDPSYLGRRFFHFVSVVINLYIITDLSMIMYIVDTTFQRIR